jgi:hypothetical protein
LVFAKFRKFCGRITPSTAATSSTAHLLRKRLIQSKIDMDWILAIMFIAGLLLTIHGSGLLFSVRYEKMMYEKGIWRRGKAFFRSEADASEFNRRFFGGQALAGGIVLIVFVLLTIWDLWGPIDRFMISDWP